MIRQCPTSSGIKVAAIAACLAFGAAVTPTFGSSMSYTFESVTNYNAVNAATAPQYAMTVEDSGTTSRGTNLVRFVFTNAGPAQSTISGVSFYGSAPLGRTSDIDGSDDNVSFSAARPPEQSTSGGFGGEVQHYFRADESESGVQGVRHIGQSVEITFELAHGYSFTHVIALLNNGLADGGDPMLGDRRFLHVGIDVTDFNAGPSESFAIIPIPLPAPVWMGIAGLGIAAAARRRSTRLAERH